MILDPTALRLYVVTSARPDLRRSHLDVAEAAIAGGATAIQVRAPELDDEQLLPVAREVVRMARDAGIPAIVNDRLEVALRAGADGVHLGQGDAVDGARERLGRDRVLGISVSTPVEARGAEAAGAAYVGVTVWETTTKRDARPMGLHGLAAVARATSLPVVGIGGIDASGAPAVLAAGARGVAVVSAVGGADDMVAATRALRVALDRATAGTRRGSEGTR
jgi:thiamine-phosphate pyrophosphorylase